MRLELLLLMPAILVVWLGSRVNGEEAGCLKNDVYPRLDVAFLQGSCPENKVTGCQKFVCTEDGTYEHHTCSELPLCRDEADLCYVKPVPPGGHKPFPECCRTERRVCPGDTGYDLQGLLGTLTRSLEREAGDSS